MDGMIMCGICLNTDVKMYKLRGYPLEDYYTWIVGNVLETNISPYFKYACYECAYYIKKYNLFREKCLRSQSILIDMLQKKRQLTNNDVKAVDRHKFNLCSNLTYDFMNNTVNGTDIKQECSMERGNNTLKEINDVNIELDVPDEEKDVIIISESDDNSFLTTPTEKVENSKRLKTKKISEEDVNNSHKNQRQNDGSEENSMGDKAAARKLQTRKRKRNSKQKTRQDPKQKTQRPIPMVDSLANDVEVITFTLEEQLAQLNKRKESPNYINSKYKCDICYKGFNDPEVFDNHMKRHDPANGSRICPICKLCYSKASSFQHHRSLHTTNYVCKECSRVCLTLSQANLHINEHKGKTYKCEHCDHVTTKRTSLFTHIRYKHPSDFICDLCGFSFVSELGLKYHKSRHICDDESAKSSVTQKGYCTSCNVYCNSREAWKSHIKTKSHKVETGQVTGNAFDKEFKDNDNFRLRQSTLHNRRIKLQQNKKASPPKLDWQCPHCDKILPTIRKYYFHLRTSHPDKPYPVTKNHVCDVCGKRFTANILLKYHIRIHKYGNYFKCTECTKTFSSRAGLYTHKLSHSEVRPYSCDVCHKAFKTNSNLTTHSKIHTGEKPYSCKYCGKAFIQSSSVKVHIMTVHLKQPAPYVSRKRRRVPSNEPELST